MDPGQLAGSRLALLPSGVGDDHSAPHGACHAAAAVDRDPHRLPFAVVEGGGSAVRPDLPPPVAGGGQAGVEGDPVRGDREPVRGGVAGPVVFRPGQQVAETDLAPDGVGEEVPGDLGEAHVPRTEDRRRTVRPRRPPVVEHQVTPDMDHGDGSARGDRQAAHPPLGPFSPAGCPVRVTGALDGAHRHFVLEAAGDPFPVRRDRHRDQGVGGTRRHALVLRRHLPHQGPATADVDEPAPVRAEGVVTADLGRFLLEGVQRHELPLPQHPSRVHVPLPDVQAVHGRDGPAVR